MARKGVVITDGRLGANAAGQPFKIMGMVTTGVAVVSGLTLGTIYTLRSIDDVAPLGLDNDYDLDNNVVVFEHVSEFFRMGGKKLYLQVNAQTVTLAQLLDDTGVAYARKVVVYAAGEVNDIAVGFNPDVSYTETLVDGINSEVRGAIVKAQAFHDWTHSTFRPANVILEGRSYGGNATSAIDLRAVPATPSGIFHADNVSIVIGQDYGFAETLSGLARKHAAIGTALGTLAACDLNQSIAEVESFNLTDETHGKWLTAGLSSHAKTADVEATLDTLDSKAYIFADIYPGISGYRWNDSPTCTPIVVDDNNNMNAFTIELGRVKNYAARLIRAKLLPWVKKAKPVSKSTGFMAPGIVKDLEGKGNEVFEDMYAKGWISDGATYVDPESDIVVERTVQFAYSIVPYGTIGQLNGSANLKIKA